MDRKIDEAAREGDRDANKSKRVYLNDGSMTSALAGLKTRVLNYINSERQAERDKIMPDLAASFQESIMEGRR